jgi:hypothetical protein
MGSYQAEWQNMHAADLRLDMEPYRLTVGGSEIVVDLRAVTHLGVPGPGPDAEAGRRHTLSYTGIYTIRDDGLLSANRTFADPVSDDLWKAFYPTLAPPSERPPPLLDPPQIRQAIEDHLYFWNVGTFEQWRARFSRNARIEDPVGCPPRSPDDTRDLWESTHTVDRRITRGSNRVIVCGLEALAHTVVFEESRQRAPRTFAQTEIFAFDPLGQIKSWRVFRDDEAP